MNRTSKAAVLIGKEKIEIQQIPIPAIGANDGLLRVEVCGVCGADCNAYKFGFSRIFDIPCPIGHEIIGVIEDIGSEAEKRWGVKKGERVAVEEYKPCGTCDNCLSGLYQICTNSHHYGGTSIHTPPYLWGGFSEYMYLDPKSIIHKVDQNASPMLLQLFIPVSNGIHWCNEGHVGPGSIVVIQGPGPMGLGSIIGAKENGAAMVIVTGLSRDAKRLEIAKELGADYVFVDDQEDIVEEIKRVTNGEMASTVINTANAPVALAKSLEVAGIKATIIQAGTSNRPTESLNGDLLVSKRLTITGVTGRPHHLVDVALRLIESGKYPLEKLCTHKFTIDETETAIRTSVFGLDGAIHVAIVNK